MRAFFAIPLSEEIKNTIDKFNSNNIVPLFNKLKKVEKENLHITLRFLGNIEEKLVNVLYDKCNTYKQKYTSFTIQIKGIGVFPSTQRARVIWIGLVNNIDKIMAIYNDINNMVKELKIEYEDEKDFNPHITIGRFRESPGYEKINSIINAYKEKEFGIISVNSITLYKSTLTQTNPIYTPLFELKF